MHFKFIVKQYEKIEYWSAEKTQVDSHLIKYEKIRILLQSDY